MRRFLLGLSLVLWASPSWAELSRLQKLYQEIRCPVCDGQSLEDSEATLAQDLRRLIRKMAAEGKSDREILAFLQRRYGDAILLRPQLNTETIPLWGFPVGMVVILVLGLGLRAWRESSRKPADSPSF